MITKDNAAQFVPLITALAAGKTLEINMGSDARPQWVDVKVPLSFSSAANNYRVKAVPQVLYVITNGCGNRSLITDDKAAAENKLSAMNSHGLYKPYTLKSFTENL